jgi:hypothetical protein
MKSHGIEFIGKVWIQRVPVLEEWTEEDPGRVLFNEEDDIVYVGGSLTWRNWIAIGHFYNDKGTAIDPDTGVIYFNRKYELSVENGNIILEYPS